VFIINLRLRETGVSRGWPAVHCHPFVTYTCRALSLQVIADNIPMLIFTFVVIIFVFTPPFFSIMKPVRQEDGSAASFYQKTRPLNEIVMYGKCNLLNHKQYKTNSIFLLKQFTFVIVFTEANTCINGIVSTLVGRKCDEVFGKALI
jgi:hypothetical protein